MAKIEIARKHFLVDVAVAGVQCSGQGERMKDTDMATDEKTELEAAKRLARQANSLRQRCYARPNLDDPVTFFDIIEVLDLIEGCACAILADRTRDKENG